MEIVYNIVLVLHFVGLAMLLGAFLLQLTSKEKSVTRWMFDGAMTQLLTGLIMVGMIEGGAMGESETVNHTKIAIKLVIVLVIAVLAAVGRRKQQPQPALWLIIGLLALANVVIAVFV
jgi:cytochrome bd-type quinol oxidase subunit 2